MNVRELYEQLKDMMDADMGDHQVYRAEQGANGTVQYMPVDDVFTPD
ncbi:MAG: hypothetical protein IJV02_05360 [Candidatus Methanomethylophilaceae archaeon]|nr:hypothetical protein [Candidatus Methanomethylophilaceae archaeon]